MTEPTEPRPLKRTIPPDLQREIDDIQIKVPRTKGPPEDLDEEQKRWLIVGICLHSIISPLLRKYVDPFLSNLFISLVASDSIDTQGYNRYLKKYPATSRYVLNYESINNNRSVSKNKKINNKWINDYQAYDYKVTSHVDLSKLFLHPSMAHYTAFDESCDSSALLAMIINISTFPSAVLTDAEKIQSDIRNPWAHCDFTVWTATKYTDSFKLIGKLVKDLGLNNREENRILGELNIWETNGYSFLSKTNNDHELRQQTHVLSEYLLTLSTETESQFILFHKEMKKIENGFLERDERIKYLESTRLPTEEMNMAKLGKIASGVLADALYDLLKLDTYRRLNYKLTPRSYWDISKLYKEHRKLKYHTLGRSNKKKGDLEDWRTIPVSDIDIGDDIERIRLIRNELQHSNSFAVDDSKYNEICTILKDVLHRFDNHNNPSHLYEDRFNEILQKTFEIEDVQCIQVEVKSKL